MKNTIIAAIAGFTAVTAAQSLGQAKVISSCASPVYIKNTPCGTSAPIYKTLSNGESYSQIFTELDGGCGWSIKIAESSEQLEASDTILQYEYTYQGGNQPVWYDMSLVNCNSTTPEMASEKELTAAQLAALPMGPYSFESTNPSTCDANSNVAFVTPEGPGMQLQCDSDISITLTLCTGDSDSGSDSSSSSSGSSSSSASAASAPSSSSVAPASSSQTTFQTQASSTPAATAGVIGQIVNEENVAPATTAAAVSTTAVVTTSTAAGGPVVVETNIDYVTQVSTVVVTRRNAEPTPVHKRHVHGHPHGGRL